MDDEAFERATDRVLLASRALVAVAARSIADAEESVTMTQFRVLVVLSSRGPMTSAALAEVLGTAASSVTRLCDRLVSKGLIERLEDPGDRRNRMLSLRAPGRHLVDSVTTARRAEIRRIVGELTRQQCEDLVQALNAFAVAAGEVPDTDWTLASLGIRDHR